MRDESLQWNAVKKNRTVMKRIKKKRDRNEGIERSKKENEILNVKQQMQ